MVRFEDGLDAAVLTKRYGTPLFDDYMMCAIYHDDVDRLRFALSQGQEVARECYKALVQRADTTLLNEVLRTRADHTRIKRVLRKVVCHPNAKKVLADHSIVV
jgi:hypothetical protein